MTSIFLNPSRFLFSISPDPSSDLTQLITLSSLKVSSCGLQDTTLFKFSFFSLAALSRSLLRISLNLPYRTSLECLWAQSADFPLLSLHSLFCQSQLFHNFKNHFSIKNSQMSISTLTSFLNSKISPLRYLVNFSNLASPKSHSQPSLQIYPSSSRLLHINKWQLHTSICPGPNLWSQFLSFAHNLLSICHQPRLTLHLKYIYNPNILQSINFYQCCPSRHHFLNE